LDLTTLGEAAREVHVSVQALPGTQCREGAALARAQAPDTRLAAGHHNAGKTPQELEGRQRDSATEIVDAEQINVARQMTGRRLPLSQRSRERSLVALARFSHDCSDSRPLLLVMVSVAHDSRCSDVIFAIDRPDLPTGIGETHAG